ncbi:hypothetical protein COCNU_15G001470 [Cocos nucifera]|uniref:Uncharacterized protein n=1 Tax=Cocos nucifera TaxID=13894 RepID=A0A8K0IX97_COCNU|nr:hypothetical protein COCNU_15G001470 [Cocos nucifera]
MHEAQHISKEAEEKANRRADDVELSKLKVEEELKKEVKRLKSELLKTRSNFEARLDAEKKKHGEELEASKIATIEAFKSSSELRDIKLEFGSLSHLQRIEDLKAKVKKVLSDFDLGLLKLDDEEVSKGGDSEIRIENLFSLAHEDQMPEDAASAPSSAMIVLSDHAEVGES